MKDNIPSSLNEATPDFEIEFSDEPSVRVAEIDLKPGETYVVNYESLGIGRLTMRENSHLLINPGMNSSNIVIDQAFIEGTAWIASPEVNGPGGLPNPNDPWRRGWWQAPGGEAGQKGCRGLDGGHGFHGIPINVKIGISKLSDVLYIESGAGGGGNGSNGGKGQIGGNRARPFRPCGPGGDGGDGGNGGNGGNGGEVNVLWFKNNDFTGLIKVLAEPGVGGQGGAGGDGAEGGNDCARGRRGRKGAPGQPGNPGKTFIDEIPKP